MSRKEGGVTHLTPRHSPCDSLLRTALKLHQQRAQSARCTLLESCRTRALKGQNQHTGMAERHHSQESCRSAGCVLCFQRRPERCKTVQLLLQAGFLFHPRQEQGYRRQHASISCYEWRRSRGPDEKQHSTDVTRLLVPLRYINGSKNQGTALIKHTSSGGADAEPSRQV